MTSQAQELELLPCPFCGSTDLLIERGGYSSCFVQCNDCGARGHESNPENEQDLEDEIEGESPARRAWNRRTTPTAGEVGPAVYIKRHADGLYSMTVKTPDQMQALDTLPDGAALYSHPMPIALSEGFVPVHTSVLKRLAEPGLVKRALGRFSPDMLKRLGFTEDEGKVIEGLYLAFGEGFDFRVPSPTAQPDSAAGVDEAWKEFAKPAATVEDRMFFQAGYAAGIRRSRGAS